MTRETIDIEALLIRAYHEKAVDRFGHGDERQRRILGKLVALNAPRNGGGGFNVGDRVQTSSYASKLASRERPLWAQIDLGGDSLLALHDAVLGLPTFWYEPLGGLDFQVWDTETAVRLGHRIIRAEGGAVIERVRLRGGSDAKRADELRPAGPRRRIKAIEVTTFLICHGRAADRPYVSDVVVTGRRPLYAGANKRATGHEPIYETPLARVVEDRAVYATWHACLGFLRETCEGFRDLHVIGPAAPAEPWNEGQPPSLGAAPRTRRAPRATEEYDASAMV